MVVVSLAELAAELLLISLRLWHLILSRSCELRLSLVSQAHLLSCSITATPDKMPSPLVRHHRVLPSGSCSFIIPGWSMLSAQVGHRSSHCIPVASNREGNLALLDGSTHPASCCCSHFIRFCILPCSHVWCMLLSDTGPFKISSIHLPMSAWITGLASQRAFL